MELIISLLLYFIVAGGLVYGIIHPEETFMRGRKWLYDVEINPSEEGLFVHRLLAVISLLFITLVLVITLLYSF